MNFRSYVSRFFWILVLSMSSWVMLSYYLDEFGHYKNCSGKQIWIEEKVSKWLFAAGCSIERYDSFIIGTSASSLNVNSSALISGTFYNFSTNAGVVSDSRSILDVALNSDQEIRNIIIGIIPPYTRGRLTEISGPTGFRLLMSSLSIEVAIRKISGMFTEDVFLGSWYGDTSSAPLNLGLPSSDRIKNDLASTVEGNLDDYFKINEQQINEFKKVLRMSRAKNIRVVGYFYEYPKVISEIPRFATLYQVYKEQINVLFDSYGFIIIDLSESDILDSSEDSNYFNMHHLSEIGATKVFNYLDTNLNLSPRK